MLRDQNQLARASVQRARQRKKSPLFLSQGSGALYSSNSPFPATRYVSISPSVSPSEEQLSICLFVDSWVLGPSGNATSTGLFEVIPALYSSVSPSSPLALCVNAIAGALYGKFVRREREVETVEVTSKLVTALKATRRALADPQESMTDETLASVCLLGFYDACVATFNAQVSSTRHFDGAATLIQRRQGQQQQPPASSTMQHMLLGLRHEIVARAVINSVPIDDTAPLYQMCNLLPQTPSATMDGMCITAANLLAKANSLSRCNAEQAASLLRDAYEVDALLASWSDSLPLHWRPVRIESKELPAAVLKPGLYEDHCEVYGDVLICGTWNEWRLTRLRVLALISQLILLLPLSPSTTAQKSQTISTIQSLADGICSSVPFVLGSRCSPVPIHAGGSTSYPPTASGAPAPADHHKGAAAWGGWILLAPMKEVMNVGMWLRPGQMAWMGQQLMRLACVYDVDPDAGIEEGERRWRQAGMQQPRLDEEEIEMHWKTEVEERIVETE